MNEFTATGTLVTSPRTGTAENGDIYLTFLLNCPRSYGKKGAGYDLLDCYIYDDERIRWAEQYLCKNQRIIIKGCIRAGENRDRFFILVSNVEFAGSNRYKNELLDQKNQQVSSKSPSKQEQKTVMLSKPKMQNEIVPGDEDELPF